MCRLCVLMGSCIGSISMPPCPCGVPIANNGAAIDDSIHRSAIRPHHVLTRRVGPEGPQRPRGRQGPDVAPSSSSGATLPLIVEMDDSAF
ncbi:hypothetical protein EYF80_049104 [Liparis tanakae]|uniref:Secreted protein n=1 Tax=Liparis tanakae TaxID=230148 RepID=A0A4Z2FIW2_9TELE|nr:hypothetical protein EYF80_049104 [Liparis tanakae]